MYKAIQYLWQSFYGYDFKTLLPCPNGKGKCCLDMVRANAIDRTALVAPLTMEVAVLCLCSCKVWPMIPQLLAKTTRVQGTCPQQRRLSHSS